MTENVHEIRRMLANATPEALAALPPEQYAELEAIIDAELWEQQRDKLFRVYPDEGPLRRELYPKHMAFFAAGAEHQERALFGGNRCITPWTPIEMARSTRLAAELIGETRLDVRSWADGSRCVAQASGVWLKSIEPAFRVHLDNGQAFDCTGKHRLLTVEGWISLDRLMSRADGLHLTGTRADSRANCGAGDRQYGRRLRVPSDSDPARPQAPVDAQRYNRLAAAPADASEPTQGYSRAYQPRGRLTTLGADDLIADLCARFEDPTHLPGALLLERERHTLARIAAVSGRRRASSAVHRGRYGWLLRDVPFFPWAHSPLVGGNRIVCVEPLGVQPILDITVEGAHCYESGGAIHHNSGKTFGVSYEGTCHLTGWYPHWWTGRRFNRPVEMWAAGEDSKSVRESLQVTYLGKYENMGTGLIPARAIVNAVPRTGVPEAVDLINIKHVKGTSRLLFKSYDQRREAFQASKVDIVQFDEEPPADIYTEGLTRTMSTDPTQESGIVMCGFTPLKGLTGVVLSYMPGGERVEGKV